MHIPRIRNLEALVNLLTDQFPILEQILLYARILSAMTVEVRHPGMSADGDDVAKALKAAVEIRGVVTEILCGAE